MYFMTIYFNHMAAQPLTKCDGALRPRASALVHGEIESQRVVTDGLGDVTEILHQVSTQRTVQQGIPQWGRGAKEIPCHGGDQAKPGRNNPSLTRL